MVHTSKSWENSIGKMEGDIGRFITGTSKTCVKAAILGEIGGISVKGKMIKRKLTFARKFEWDKQTWGRTILEWAGKEGTKSNGGNKFRNMLGNIILTWRKVWEIIRN